MPTIAMLRHWGEQLGFSQIGVSDIDLRSAEPGLAAWIAAGWHGTMAWFEAHGSKRTRPAELVPGTVRVITAWMDYLPAGIEPREQLARQQARTLQPGEAVISLYAQGRDYHKVLRARLARLAQTIGEAAGAHGYRVFTDSAPVMEVELASRSGLGWRGKHTLALRRDAGSTGFLGEIYTDLPLPVTPPDSAHCGSCTACIDACPTGAIVAPYRVDARRCISYLTIEHQGSIDPSLRPLLGNRIYGCDDCQTVCPWNRHARTSPVVDFAPRNGLEAARLTTLWAWTRADFDRRLEGSPIRRIGWQRWRRNLAVASGNALASGRLAADVAHAVTQSLVGAARSDGDDAVIAEHVAWALAQAQAAGAMEQSGPAP